jgi:NADPH:quinone reductase
MRAIVMSETGGPEVLRLAEAPVPSPGKGQVLIRTEVIGTHFAETRLRAGALPGMSPKLPSVPGFEAAGIVTEVGDGVDPALLNTRVTAIAVDGTGSYAEYVAVPAEGIVAIPDGVSAHDAVAVASQGAVALGLLRAARLTGREQVLVEAAGGAIGGYLVQLAREHGAARIIGTAGSPAKRDLARELGADVTVDHRDPDWADLVSEAAGGAAVDVVFESIGGASAGRLLDAMTPGSGRMLFYGMLSDEPPAVTPTDLMYRGLTLVGCGGRPGDGAWYDQVMAARTELMERVAAGRIRPLVDSVLPLADAAEAHRRLESRQNLGKIILTP